MIVRRYRPPSPLVIVVALLSVSVLSASTSNAPIPLTIEQALPNLYRPTTVRADSAGRLLVLLSRDHSVARIDEVGRIVARYGRIGNGPGELLQPIDFDVDEQGNVCVADRGNDRIECFDRSGNHASLFAVFTPMEIRSIGGGRWAVVGVHDRSPVIIYSIEGERLRTLGEVTKVPGANEAQDAYLSRPHIAVDGDRILLLYSRLVPPQLRRYLLTGERELDMTMNDPELGEGLENARKHYKEVLPTGTLAYAQTALSVATSHNHEVWVGLAQPLIVRYKADGRRVAAYVPTTTDGHHFAFSNIYIASNGIGYGIARNQGLYTFQVPQIRD